MQRLPYSVPDDSHYVEVLGSKVPGQLLSGFQDHYPQNKAVFPD